MRSRASVKPSQYPPIPFHTIRFFGLISTFIVGIILAVFVNQLHSNNYKLPWAFLIVRLPYLPPPPQSMLYTPLTPHPNSSAPHSHRLLPPKFHPHHHNPLLLWPLPASQPRHQQHCPRPLAHRPRSPKLEHVPHHPNDLQHNLLGHLHRYHRLQDLQGPLHLHHCGRDSPHRRRRSGHYRLPSPDPPR